MLGKIEAFFYFLIDALCDLVISYEEVPSALVSGIRCPNQDCDGYLIASPPALQGDYAIAMPVAPVMVRCTRCEHLEAC